MSEKLSEKIPKVGEYIVADMPGYFPWWVYVDWDRKRQIAFPKGDWRYKITKIDRKRVIIQTNVNIGYNINSDYLAWQEEEQFWTVQMERIFDG